MNRNDVIRWATQCKMPYDYVTGEIVEIEKLEALATLVAEHEREKCAKACEDEDVAPTDDPIGVQWCIAKSIRERGQA